MTNEEVVRSVVKFGDFLDMYKDFSKVYTDGTLYSEGRRDAVISMSTLYNIVFEEILEEKRRDT